MCDFVMREWQKKAGVDEMSAIIGRVSDLPTSLKKEKKKKKRGRRVGG